MVSRMRIRLATGGPAVSWTLGCRALRQRDGSWQAGQSAMARLRLLKTTRGEVRQ